MQFRWPICRLCIVGTFPLPHTAGRRKERLHAQQYSKQSAVIGVPGGWRDAPAAGAAGGGRPVMTVLLSAFAVGPALPDDDMALLRRIGGEFLEMPDLTLTAAEASRLFALELTRCRRILERLVARGILSSDGRYFARAGTGRRYV